MMPQRRAAFFDFDGTLIRGDSQAMEARRCMLRQRRPARLALRLVSTMVTGVLAGLGLVSQRAHNQAYLRTYRGRMAADLLQQGEDLFEEEIRRAFFSQALAIVAAHRQAKDVIILVSATPRHIMAPVGYYLKPDFLICTQLETDTLDQCTGRSAGAICIGAEKARRIRALAAGHHLDLAASYAYTDHHVDLPLLESVGHPRIVNPTRQLEKTARRRGWSIHHF